MKELKKPSQHKVKCPYTTSVSSYYQPIPLWTYWILRLTLLHLAKGDILIHRSFRDDVGRREALQFSNRFVATRELGQAAPVNSIGSCHFVHIVQGDVAIVGTTRVNSNVLLIVAFLYKFVEVLKFYFGPGHITEHSVRKNFVLIYELLDEALDYGYPQILEIDVLRRYITQGGAKLDGIVSCGGYKCYGNTEDFFSCQNCSTTLTTQQVNQLTVQATGATSWRADGIKYRKNEVYLDVVEHVNVQVSKTGQLLSADVMGQVVVKCHLSGHPECKFGMNEKLGMPNGYLLYQQPRDNHTQSVALDDVRFHQCVRISRFEADRAITFVPPDGTFELMTYRVTENIRLPINLLTNILERGRHRLEYSIKLKSLYPKTGFATNVIVKIPCPRNAAKASIGTLHSGKAKFDSSASCIFWRIRRLTGQSEVSLLADVELVASIKEPTWIRPPIELTFQVPMFTASGLTVRFLRVYEKTNYKTIKWIRYITKAGHYQFRI